MAKQEQAVQKHWDGGDQAPSGACRFDITGDDALRFAEGPEKPGFSIVGYTGEILKGHWYWGNVAFDLSGLKFAKKRMPVLEEHFTSRRIGFATKQEISDKVTFEGVFLDNDIARQIAGDLKAGFPMEASLYVSPSIVEMVKDGASVEVNGRTLKGPGAVFRKAIIREVSMCVFGWDANTESTAYKDNEGNHIFTLIKETDNMAKQANESTEPMTAVQFKTEHEALYKEIFEAGRGEGAKAETDRFTRLQQACGGDGELLVKCFAEKMDTGQAQAARIEKLSAANAELSRKLAEGKPPEKKADPAVSEFSNQPAAAPGTSVKFDEDKATDAEIKDHFAKTQDIQDRFSSADAYVAYVRHKG